jgi:signal transduction histidine kinase
MVGDTSYRVSTTARFGLTDLLGQHSLHSVSTPRAAEDVNASAECEETLTDLRARFSEPSVTVRDRGAGLPPDVVEPTLQCPAVPRLSPHEPPVRVELSIVPPPTTDAPPPLTQDHPSPSTGRATKVEVTRLRDVTFPSLLEPVPHDVGHSRSPVALRGQHLRPAIDGEQDAGGVGRFWLNPSDGTMTWNAEMFTIFGYPTTETPSPDALLSRIHPSDLRLFGSNTSSAQARLVRFAKSGRTMLDVRVELPNGKWRRVTLKAQLVSEPDSSVKVVGIALDTTERALVEQQLLRQQHAQTLSALVGGIAHEFNNPMQSIVNYAHLIATTSEDPVLADFAGEILEASERVTGIMRNLLEFARLDPKPAQPISLSAVVDGSLALTQTSLRKDNIIVESDVPSDLPLITGEHNQLQQVVINLITNSRAALNERFPRPTAQKELCLTGRQERRGDQDWVTLEVRDHGIGIPSELQLAVFEPFVTTKHRVDGAGLGLSICRTIVERHGGTIHIESDGATYTAVTISLPERGGHSPLESLRPTFPPNP